MFASILIAVGLSSIAALSFDICPITPNGVGVGLDIGESPAAKPARTIVIEFAGVYAECKCKAVVNPSDTDDRIYQCPNGTAQYAQISINSGSPYEPPCDCESKLGADCTGLVTAQLVIPATCLNGIWNVTGPGIGTGGAPCQDAVNGGKYKATWNLSAKCKIASESGAGQEMLVHDQPCGGSTGNIVLRYKPVLVCGACK